MKIAYKNQRFKRDSMYIIKHSDSILAEYAKQGYLLTLRQLYYKIIARDLFPEHRKYTWNGKKWVKDKTGTKNAQPNYKWLGAVINNARLCGLIDWDYIEDRTRNIRALQTWNNPAEILKAVMQSYRSDRWENMNYYIEVWVEKDALIEVIKKAAFHYQVPCFSCRGYVSQSEMHNSAARRFIRKQNRGKKNILLHLGDHDPSGIDMSRDIKDRLQLFGVKIKVKRIALNMNQIKKYNPPPSPAKITDSRYESYLEKFGDDSWELDALEPSVLDALIKKHIVKYIDGSIWEMSRNKEFEDIQVLEEIVTNLRDE